MLKPKGRTSGGGGGFNGANGKPFSGKGLSAVHGAETGAVLGLLIVMGIALATGHGAVDAAGRSGLGVVMGGVVGAMLGGVFGNSK